MLRRLAASFASLRLREIRRIVPARAVQLDRRRRSSSQVVRPSIATTAGMPSSRATMAECESRLPRSTSKPSARGKQHDPARDRCARRRESRRRRSIALRGSRTTRTGPRTTPGQQPVPRRVSPSASGLVTRRVGRGATEIVPGVHEPARLEAVGRRRQAPIARELGLPRRGDRCEVGAGARASDQAERLVHLQIEDVARLVERAGRGEAPAQLDEDAPHAAEHARALEAQVLAVAHAVARRDAAPSRSTSPLQRRAPPSASASARSASARTSGRAAAALGRSARFRARGLARVGPRRGAAQRIVVERRPFELQLLEAAVAERVAGTRRVLAANSGRATARPARSRSRPSRQRLDAVPHRSTRAPPVRDPRGRLGADDAALAADQIVLQRAARHRRTTPVTACAARRRRSWRRNR